MTNKSEENKVVSLENIISNAESQFYFYNSMVIEDYPIDVLLQIENYIKSVRLKKERGEN